MLVHTDGTGKHPGPDVPGPHHLQEPLNGAVLAVRSVQEGERDIDWAEVRQRGLLANCELAAAGDSHEQGFGRVLAEFGQSAVADSEPADRLRIHQDPPSGTRNADAHYIEPISIQCAQHPGRSEAGHPMFATGSPENHRYAMARTV